MGQEIALLRSAGHYVIEYRRSNMELNRLPWPSKLGFPMRVIWAPDAVKDLHKVIKTERPDIAYFHNTFAMISPAAYYACQKMAIPVLQTLHNYRLLCPRADFFRNGRVCEDCLGKTPPWPGILYGCYRGSRAQTACVATMLTVHRWLQTWQRQVDTYIALTEFGRQKFIEGGLPRQKIVVKPNFVYPDPGGVRTEGREAIYVGRFTPEKRLVTLLDAGAKLRERPLKIVGGGPEPVVQGVYKMIKDRKLENAEMLGWMPRDDVLKLMKESLFLIFTSAWYEGFPMTVVEAFACGVPVVASRLGVMPEIVEDGRTGLLFRVADPDDLAAKARWAFSHPKEMAEMGRRARQEFEAKYTAERNYEMMMTIYQLAIERARERN